MVWWRLKSCPRCFGDIFIVKDIDGWYEQCLQCSYWHELKDLSEFDKQPAAAGKAQPGSQKADQY